LAALLSCAPAPTSRAADSTEPAVDGVAVAESTDAASWGDAATATDVPDAGAELVRKYVNPWTDGNMMSEPWPPIATTAGFRIFTGTVVAIDAPVLTLEPAFEIEDLCPGVYYGEAFTRVSVLPDGVIDESLFGPGEEACGWSPPNEDGTVDLWYGGDIVDLYTRDWEPHPVCTFSYDEVEPPESYGLTSSKQLLFIANARQLRSGRYTTLSRDDVLKVPFRYRFVASAPVDDAPFKRAYVELSVEELVTAVVEGRFWLNSRALCDFILAGSPEGKSWEDYLPKGADDSQASPE
jgi:hypothetical protein